jgi:putative molybdopterin biosynthesis protein
VTDERLYTVEEVAQMLRVSEGTVTNAIKAGGLVAYKVGKQYRITEAAIKAWAQSSRPNEADV